MKKIKILLVNPTSILGGGTIVSNDLAVGLDKTRFEVFSFFPETGPASKYLEGSTDINTVFPGARGPFGIVRFLRVFILAKRIDIVHAHGTRAAFWVRVAVIGLKRRFKVIYTVHGFHIARKHPIVKFLLMIAERVLSRWTDAVVCVSRSDMDLINRYGIVSQNKTVLIHNGIDIERFSVNPVAIESKKNEIGLRGKFILTSIARLSPQKDISTAIKAIKIAAQEIKNIALLVVGDGTLLQILEQEVRTLGLSEYVKFLGARDDVSILINLSDVVVLSTNWEGLPLVPLEAGAARKPIIASNVDGVREVVVGGKTGFLFKPGSSEDLAEKIKILLENPDLRREMGENGYRFVSENFSLEKMLKSYQALYENFAGKPR